MGLFSRRRKSEDCTGLHADASGIALVRIGMATARRPVLRASAFSPGDGELPASSVVEELAREISASGNDLNVVLASRDYQLLMVEAPRVDADELRAAIRWRVKDLIDFHIDDAVFDVFAVPGQQNRPRGQASMYAVAARASRVQALVDCIDDSALQIQVIDIQELAMRNLAALTEHDTRGIVMVQLGPSGGLLTISHQHELYMTRQLELDNSDPELTEASMFEQVLLEIQRSIDYYGSHFGQPAPVALSILPGYERAAALVEWLDDQIDQAVEVFDITRHMKCETALDTEGIDQRLIAIGGALRREEVKL